LIEFRIDTTPQSAPRPRVTRFGVHYDKKYEAYRQEVGLRAKAAMLGREPLAGAVMVVIEFCLSPPASTSN
jgi:Holliday junction resolvase RusA-like endonuclease